MPRWGRTWTELLLDICLPRACAACRRDLEPPLEGPLCGDCMAALAPIAPPLCGFCGAPLRGSADCRRACRRDLPSLDAARAAFLYKAPLRQLLHAFKYAGSARAGAALAGWLAGLAPRHPILRRAEVVVPVPLHAVKLRRRGFNQAQVLAAHAGRALALPVRPLLQRPDATLPQWKFGREQRAARLLRAFLAPAPDAVRGRAVLLVDDVCTSGGTLEGCARALKAAGAEWVGAYVLARG